MGQVEKRLLDLGFTLPKPPKPISAGIPTVRTGNLVFVSGQGPEIDGKWIYQGKVGEKYTAEEGCKAAQLTILNSLAHLKEEIGDLDKVKRIVKLMGWVNSSPGFIEQPYVINGASELLLKAFGEKGKHARSAVGAYILCFDIPVEIDLIVEVEDTPID
jgi:enamine deaminase RidA (YjgF/YER057c/UK114 family)